MARNGSGVYTKVNTFVSNNPVTAAGHNQNWDDLVTEMTNSVAADGQTSMTGPLKASSGTAALPSHTFASDPNTGGYRSASDEYSIAAGGSQIVAVSSAGIDIKAGNLLLAGVAAFPVPTAQIAGDAVTYAKIQNVSATSRLLGRATAGAGDIEELTVGTALEFSGSSINLSAARRTLPTRQAFTAGSGTYTTPANCLYINVRMVGGGGGGGGSGSSGAGNGGNGGNTTFSTFTANGGVGGVGSSATSNAGGAGGTASGGTINLAGQNGASCVPGPSVSLGGAGGGSAFFNGAGQPFDGAGGSATANTGGGGAGGSRSTTAAGGSGGGAGGSCEGWINSPAATYSYAVGANGSAGTAGVSGNNGGSGGLGYIIVEEFYN